MKFHILFSNKMRIHVLQNVHYPQFLPSSLHGNKEIKSFVFMFLLLIILTLKVPVTTAADDNFLFFF